MIVFCEINIVFVVAKMKNKTFLDVTFDLSYDFPERVPHVSWLIFYNGLKIVKRYDSKWSMRRKCRQKNDDNHLTLKKLNSLLLVW